VHRSPQQTEDIGGSASPASRQEHHGFGLSVTLPMPSAAKPSSICSTPVAPRGLTARVASRREPCGPGSPEYDYVVLVARDNAYLSDIAIDRINRECAGEGVAGADLGGEPSSET
jgi:hypothetical protein